MGHVVARRDGTGWHLEDVATLAAALERVEHLRNEDADGDVRLFEELALEVRTYVRVALAADAPTGAVERTDAPVAPVADLPASEDRRSPADAPGEARWPGERAVLDDLPAPEDLAVSEDLPAPTDLAAPLDRTTSLHEDAPRPQEVEADATRAVAPVRALDDEDGEVDHVDALAAVATAEVATPGADDDQEHGAATSPSAPVEVPAAASRASLPTPTIHDVVRGVEGVAAQRAEPAAPATAPAPAVRPDVPLPGAFTLAGPPVAHAAEDTEESAPARRGSRFGRDR